MRRPKILVAGALILFSTQIPANAQDKRPQSGSNLFGSYRCVSPNVPDSCQIVKKTNGHIRCIKVDTERSFFRKKLARLGVAASKGAHAKNLSESSARQLADSFLSFKNALVACGLNRAD